MTYANSPRRTDPVPEGLKRCSRCEVDYPHPFFHRNAAKRDGLDGWCRTCVSLRNARYEQMRGRGYGYVLARPEQKGATK